jgi:hypothetical protein
VKASTKWKGVARYRWLLLVTAVVLVVWALANWLPPAYDFHIFFRPVVWDWLRGQSPYDAWKGFWNPPWMLLCLLPFALPPEPLGRALLFVFSVTVVMWGLRSVRRRRAATVLTLVSIPCLALFWHGQVEVFLLLGVWLGSWAIWERRSWALSAGLLLMGLKPQETALVVLLLLWHIRRWRWRECLRVATLPAMALVFSVAAFGLDWLHALYAAGDVYRETWINTSWIWRIFGPSRPGLAMACSLGIAALALGLTVSRPLTPYTLALVVTINVLASPYAATHHLVLSLVLAWPWLLDRHPLLALLVYLVSLTPLARLGGGQRLNWLDFLFPVALTVALLFFYREQKSRGMPEE